MSQEKLLTHKDLAKLLGVSETTVKSYRRKFPDCIPVASNGKPIRFTAEAASVALKIRDLFSTGMSVEEVRLRLSENFSWIAPKEKKVKKQLAYAAAPSEISTGVSSMAKSMVLMSQQQKSMLGRMESIEAILGDLGISVDFDSLDEKRKQQKSLELEKQNRIEERLNNLDMRNQELMQTVGLLAEQLENFFSSRVKAKEKWQRESTINAMDEEIQAINEYAESTAQAQPADRKVITLYGKSPQEFVNQSDEPEQSSEPARNFLNLPLVVRSSQGNYIGAWGRSRGRFSLNDLKAMLVYGFTPPNHYSLSWKAHGQGWWLNLSQPECQNGEHLEFLLMQVSMQGGESVVDILQIKRNGERVHPAEISAILDSIVV